MAKEFVAFKYVRVLEIPPEERWPLPMMGREHNFKVCPRDSDIALASFVWLTEAIDNASARDRRAGGTGKFLPDTEADPVEAMSYASPRVTWEDTRGATEGCLRYLVGGWLVTVAFSLVPTALVVGAFMLHPAAGIVLAGIFTLLLVTISWRNGGRQAYGPAEMGAAKEYSDRHGSS